MSTEPKAHASEENSTDNSPSSSQHTSKTNSNHEKVSSFSSSPSSLLPAFTIHPVRTPADLNDITRLFTSYADSLGLDLSFQDFASELSTLPGKYSPSQGGELFLARSLSSSAEGRTITLPNGGDPIGCVALRALPSSNPSSLSSSTPTGLVDPKICEMKRLYVSLQARGLGVGLALARKVIDAARLKGYTEMRLDTLAAMGSAQKMYQGLGFVDIEPYCVNPVPGTRFLGLDLR